MNLVNRYKNWRLQRLRRKIDKILDDYRIIPDYGSRSDVRFYNYRITKVWMRGVDNDIYSGTYHVNATERRIKYIKAYKALKEAGRVL